jgi:hypothetical protein
MTYDVMLALELIGNQNPTSRPKMSELPCKFTKLDELENQIKFKLASLNLGWKKNVAS